MIGYMRSVRILGSHKDAMAYATQMVAHLNGKGYDASCWVEIGGEPSVLHYWVSYPDMATMESRNAELFADEKYWEMIEQSREADLFDGPSIEDRMLYKIA